MAATSDEAPKARISASRRLAAITVVDVVGFSGLMEADETTTLGHWQRLSATLIVPTLADHNGEIIKSTGDGFLIEFRSVVEAVRWSLELQAKLASDEDHAGLRLRIAVHIGDIVDDGNDIAGSDINVASRLQEFAPPGRTIISAIVHERVRPVLQYDAQDLGLIQLKNIRQAIHAYAIGRDDHPVAQSPPPRPVNRSAEPSIAVLPFRTLGADDVHPHLAEGLVYDICESLAAIRELFVVASSSAIAISKETTDIAEIGRRLGVRYVVTGTIRSIGTAMRLQTELVAVETLGIVWREGHDVDGRQIFAAQDQIATRVARSLLPHLRQSELQRALRKRPEHVEAYDLVLQALHRLYRFSAPDFLLAGDLLRQAIARDPGYSTAYAWAAQWQIFKIGQGYSFDQDADSREAQRLATMALDQNPTDPRALAVYGHTLAFLFRQHERAIEVFDRAITYSPNSAIAWGMSAPTFYYVGDYDRAIERARYALVLSPLDPLAFFFQTSLTIAHYLKGEFDEAIRWGQRTMAGNLHYSANLRPLAAALTAVGRIDEARSIGTEVLAIEPAFSVAGFVARYPMTDTVRLALYGEHLRLAGLPA